MRNRVFRALLLGSAIALASCEAPPAPPPAPPAAAADPYLEELRAQNDLLRRQLSDAEQRTRAAAAERKREEQARAAREEQ